MINGSETSQAFILGRGWGFCRGCLKRGLFTPLDLGKRLTAIELCDQCCEIEKFWLHSLLKNFLSRGFTPVGVEPAENVAEPFRS